MVIESKVQTYSPLQTISNYQHRGLHYNEKEVSNYRFFGVGVQRIQG